MEIMGLAIIIILISLAMLFVIRFIAIKEPGELKKTYTHKELAANIANTILMTTAKDCKGQDMTSLIQDCANNHPLGLIECDDGTTRSCDYIDTVIQEILDKTLESWNKEYYLTIKSAGIDISKFGAPCPGAKTSSSPCCPIPIGIVVNLDICG